MPNGKQPYQDCTSSREVWDLALQSRIEQLDVRFHRHDEAPQTERLNKLLAGILAHKQYYVSKKYDMLNEREQAIIDNMKPFGKVWARARSNKDF